ncbi:MAG: gamma-glutamyltransferase family protein [Gemmatimonadota bacterium]
MTVRTARVLGALVLAGCTASGPSPTPAPETGKRVVAERGAVSSASAYASEAGVTMLRRGGNAIDAAVATAFAVGVVEPQMSGLGGGGSMLIWLQDEGRAEYLDFYAAQPVAPFRDAGPRRDPDLRIVAVPGKVAGLLAAHERFGRLDRATVMAPAIRLAEEGFPVNQILARMIASDSAKLRPFDGFGLLFPDGPLVPGMTLRNPTLAESLRRVAGRGKAGFYRGPTARAVLHALREGGHPASAADFAGYEPQWKRPLCSVYDGRVVLSAPPPQTGIQVLHSLELLEAHDLEALGLPTRSPEAFDVLTSALRVGATVRRFNGDPRWVDVPARGLASEAYARERARLVGTGRPPETVDGRSAAAFDALPYPEACAAYDPWGGREGPDSGGDVELDDAGETTHISVVDAAGNAVALTQTNSSLFGSGAFAAGFFLNDSAYRFDRQELEGTAPAEWRTRTSTIAPTIVLEQGRARMVVGAPGGGRIPTAIVQTMAYALDYGMDPMEALRMPRIFPDHRDRDVELEGGFSAETLRQVRAMGYAPGALSFGYARLYMIVRDGDRWIAVADPRHDGEPRGY